MSDIVVLGVDPGFAAFGWGIMRLGFLGWGVTEEVVEMGVIRTKKSAKKQRVKSADDNFVRAQEIATRLHEIVKKWKPAAIAAESMSFPRSASSAAKLMMSWGVLSDLTVVHNLALVQASPQEIKKCLCDTKSASKEEVQLVLCSRYPGVGVNDFKENFPSKLWEHGFDAVGAVVSCLNSDVIRMARRLAK